MAPVFAYMAYRGLAQPVRLLLEYTGTEYEEIRYGKAPEYSKQEWYKVKHTLGLDFPNLPYYIDGDLKLSQSIAILRHIARQHNLCGKTAREMAIVEMLEYEAVDFREGHIQLLYGPDYDKNKDAYYEKIRGTLKTFSEYLGSKKFFSGDELTYVDFIFYEHLDQHKIWDASVIEPHQNIKDFLARIEALPAIAAYMKSDRFIYRPIYNPISRLH